MEKEKEKEKEMNILNFFAIILLTLSTSANATLGQPYGGTYFTSQGNEVKIIYNTFKSSVSALGFIIECYTDCDSKVDKDSSRLLTDFVNAVKYNRLYTYNPPPSDCIDTICDEPFDTEPLLELNSTERGANDYFALKTDSSSTDAITKQVANDSNNNSTPIYTIVYETVGTRLIPKYVCKIHSQKTCLYDDGVTFTVFDDGKIDVVENISSTTELYDRGAIITNYFENVEYQCTMTLTGTFPNNLVAKRVCIMPQDNSNRQLVEAIR